MINNPQSQVSLFVTGLPYIPVSMPSIVSQRLSERCWVQLMGNTVLLVSFDQESNQE